MAMSDAVEDLPPGVQLVNGIKYMVGPKGLMNLSLVDEKDLLEDAVVRELHAKGEALERAIGEYKHAAFAAVDAYNDLLWEKYGAKAPGVKGNQTLSSYDKTLRVLVQVADQIAFGDELQVAKTLVMECVHDWATTSRAELVALVENAFRVDKAGQINRGALLSLLRLNITDPKWLRGMDAIRDSIRVEGSKRYIRLAKRARADDAWSTVALDMANARPIEPAAAPVQG